MRKLILLLFIISLQFSKVISSIVPIDKAESVAINIFYERNHYLVEVSYKDIIINKVYTVKDDIDAIYYIFNISLKNRQEKGFVIVSAEDKVRPVPGYSFEGEYSDNSISPEFEYWMNNYKKQIISVRHSLQTSISSEIKDEWTKYTKIGLEKSDLISKSATIGPFISTIWGQGCFYNALCPYDIKSPNGDCEHVPTGCEATAMAQILRYWNYPISGTGAKSYTGSYGTLSADFSSVYYDWEDMIANLIGSCTTAQKNAIATLMFDCGIALSMNYNINGSASTSEDFSPAFTNYFNYAANASLVFKSHYADSVWVSLIKNQLNSNMPIIYCGQDPKYGGHAFVCDGYEANDYFHINWGWDNLCNGYYLLTDLAPVGQPYDFSKDGSAIINIYPGAKIEGMLTVLPNQKNCEYNLNYYNPYNIEWTVSGGDIISGQGTSNIIVDWNQKGTGQINITLNFDKGSSQKKTCSVSQNINIASDTIYLCSLTNHVLQINVNSRETGNMVINLYTVTGKKIESLTYNKDEASFIENVSLPNIANEIVIAEILLNNKKIVKKVAIIN